MHVRQYWNICCQANVRDQIHSSLIIIVCSHQYWLDGCLRIDPDSPRIIGESRLLPNSLRSAIQQTFWCRVSPRCDIFTSDHHCSQYKSQVPSGGTTVAKSEANKYYPIPRPWSSLLSKQERRQLPAIRIPAIRIQRPGFLPKGRQATGIAFLVEFPAVVLLLKPLWGMWNTPYR